MGLFNWIFGINDEARAEGKRLVEGMKRLADLTHALADKGEELAGLRTKQEEVVPKPSRNGQAKIDKTAFMKP